MKSAPSSAARRGPRVYSSPARCGRGSGRGLVALDRKCADHRRQSPGDPGGNEEQRWARIVEVTHSESAEKVFEIILLDEPPSGYQVHRAGRLSSLYP